MSGPERDFHLFHLVDDKGIDGNRVFKFFEAYIGLSRVSFNPIMGSSKILSTWFL